MYVCMLYIIFCFHDDDGVSVRPALRANNNNKDSSSNNSSSSGGKFRTLLGMNV